MVLLAGASLVTLVVLFYAVENWRGTRAWNQYKREREARGERFDQAAHVPPPVPDDQNFAMTPLLRPILDIVPNSRPTRWRDPAGYERLVKLSVNLGEDQWDADKGRPKLTLGEAQSGALPDLEVWAAFYRGNTNYAQAADSAPPAAVVLKALSRFDVELAELQQAAARPHSRFPVAYGAEDPFSILLPHLARVKSMSRVVALRAVARLESGQAPEALADVRLCLRLGDALKEEPILISLLVRQAVIAASFAPVRTGLARHAWSDAQLAAIEQDMAGMDLLRQYRASLRAEKVMSVVGLEYYHRKGWPVMPFGESSTVAGTPLQLALKFMPLGWLRRNHVVNSRLIEDYGVAAVDDQAQRIDPVRADGLDQAIRELGDTPVNVLARLLLPALGKACQRTAQAQTGIYQCRLACALERYRLAQGRFPETLKALEPRFLGAPPHDLFTGEPLRYRVEPDGGYALYSTGWNRTDEKGLQAEGGGTVRAAGGDWVWKCPVLP